MKPFSELETPFTVQSPEDMSADDMVHLFVNVFTDFPKVPHPGHAFLHGPRGSGKSMMFRYLEPDCQMLARKCSLQELPFYGIYIPVKNTELSALSSSVWRASTEAYRLMSTSWR